MTRCRSIMRGALALVVVALLAIPLGATRADAAAPVPYEGPSWMARLAMVGDSQTWTSADTFKPALQADWWRPAIFSFPGVRTETMRDQVRSMAADRPDAFVVELGGMDTLDIISGARSWAFEQAQIDGTIADIQGAGVPCVVWVGPNQHFDGGPIDAWSTAINDEIRYRLAVRGAGVFADWTTVAAGHPEYFVADGSHMTDAGKQVYVAMIKDSLRNCTRNPHGNLDVVTGGIGARVQGWSYDPDTNASIPVHVYVDGAFKGVSGREHLAARRGRGLPWGERESRLRWVVRGRSGDASGVCVRYQRRSVRIHQSLARLSFGDDRRIANGVRGLGNGSIRFGSSAGLGDGRRCDVGHRRARVCRRGVPHGSHRQREAARIWPRPSLPTAGVTATTSRSVEWVPAAIRCACTASTTCTPQVRTACSAVASVTVS